MLCLSYRFLMVLRTKEQPTWVKWGSPTVFWGYGLSTLLLSKEASTHSNPVISRTAKQFKFSVFLLLPALVVLLLTIEQFVS